MVLASINKSTAKKFAVDPASTLKDLDHTKIRERADYVIKRLKDEPPKDQCITKERRLQKIEAAGGAGCRPGFRMVGVGFKKAGPASEEV